ncbi:MAG: glutamate--tRNA ligase [Myxococcota bacterium]|nr:glutamate--tRNA ligase [Myxococcota bacterium]
MSEQPVRVRIGPSPTGEPHVGTAYIALFNLAFARQQGGKFVLRIEDTDRERSKLEWEKQIMEGLRWLGLEWDEGPDKGGPHGPYRQSERGDIYREYVQKLIDSGHAYRCFCTKERLDELREKQRAEKTTVGYDRHCRDLSADEIRAKLDANVPYVVRMKMPLDGETIVNDRLRGQVTIANDQVDDQVLLKSDGFPTYHLANVVDDHLMKITHVIRAEEWINSTPKHVVLYNMFGWEPPVFIHMPLLRNPDKSKISKRKNPVSILDYQQRGFLPPAVLNYLAMLGWTMPDGKELFSLDEFVANFTWDRMHLGGPIFDLEKLTWLNGRYFREEMTDSDLISHLEKTVFTRERLEALVPLMRGRIDVTEQFLPATQYFYCGDLEFDPTLLKPKKRTYKELRKAFEGFADELDRQLNFTPDALEAFARAYIERKEWSGRDFFMPLRIALTGSKATPPLFDTMAIMGRALTRRRLRAAITLLKKAASEESKQKQKQAKGA